MKPQQQKVKEGMEGIHNSVAYTPRPQMFPFSHQKPGFLHETPEENTHKEFSSSRTWQLQSPQLHCLPRCVLLQTADTRPSAAPPYMHRHREGGLKEGGGGTCTLKGYRDEYDVKKKTTPNVFKYC